MSAWACFYMAFKWCYESWKGFYSVWKCIEIRKVTQDLINLAHMVPASQLVSSSCVDNLCIMYADVIDTEVRSRVSILVFVTFWDTHMKVVIDFLMQAVSF